ncbi:MAG TPA: mechanosensitive ion channel domain-containing protein [Anaerolineae bacterium]|nr:mechanosensitive ion channel domain-containing protein [Anaerolineae bacterium]
MTRRIIPTFIAAILLIAIVCALDNVLGPSSQILPSLLALPFKVIFIGAVFLLAFMIHRLAWYIAGSLLHSSLLSRLFLWSSNRLATRFGSEVAEVRIRTERQYTIRHLVASTISIAAFVIAALLSLGQFLSAESLALFAGLFTAAFSLGARPLIADMLAGVNFIFEDSFDVGEKVEIASATGRVVGVVESMNLQTTLVRAPSGELYVVPNRHLIDCCTFVVIAAHKITLFNQLTELLKIVICRRLAFWPRSVVYLAPLFSRFKLLCVFEEN